ncbi:NUDIX domain-containing protein [Streptomyces violaceoruber]|uniref:NUDIX domain-containing protein n=1 Tax=Streptomyces violaceoruber TaxID=1935 RepID=UPI001F3617E9|nr:NUDIX domain-containing protein [Streptomyces violaceoruber]
MLIIRCTRPGIPEYWVLPGGGVEPGDESKEAALYREIHEEIAGKANIVRLFHTMETDDERQFFYLAPHRDLVLRRPHRSRVQCGRVRRVCAGGDSADLGGARQHRSQARVDRPRAEGSRRS